MRGEKMITNRVNRRINHSFCAFFLLMAFILVIPVMATFGESDERTETVYGYTYTFQSYIHNEVSGRIGYQTTVWVTNADSVPVGYMGAKARLYNSSGNVIDSVDFEYNHIQAKTELRSGVYNTTSGYYYMKNPGIITTLVLEEMAKHMHRDTRFNP